MTNDNSDKRGPNLVLRSLAEARLRARGPSQSGPLSMEDTLALAHELQVHQIELEIQNDELRNLNDRLTEQHDRFKAALEGTNDGIWDWKVDSEVVWRSPRFWMLLGFEECGPFPPDTFEAWSERLHPKDQFATLSLLDNVANEGAAFDCEYRLRTQHHGYRWFHARAKAQRDHFGAVTRVAGSIQDIDARKRAEFKLRKLQEEAEASSRGKGEFLAIMSHEIRTPLSGILGMNRLLLDTTLNPEQRDFAETACLSGETLLGLINDILDFSRIEAGKLEIAAHPFQLRTLIDRMERLLSYRVQETGVTVHWELPANIPDIVEGDETRIGQVLINLVGNAIKFSHTGAAISVQLQSEEITKDQFQIRFSVVDSGMGMDADTCDKIFAPFTQADSSTTRRFGGTGLGLTICRQLVELMGGRIWVHSELEVGSVFHFTVPLTRAADSLHTERHQRDDQIAELASHSPSRRLEILLVEDNLVNQKLIRTLLQKQGHRVSLAADGIEAIEMLERETSSYSLILMDCQMPRRNGFETTEMIRELELNSGKHIPIIALTANAMAGDRERCLACGMDDFLSKPIDARSLEATIRQWAGQHPQANENRTVY